MAMHRALQVDDILQLVFSCLCRKDNYHLALTCHTFLEPALDQVWRCIEDLGPLYRLWSRSTAHLPTAKTTAGEHRSGNRLAPFGTNAFFLGRTLAREDWTRFDYHARRIRRLYMTSPGQDTSPTSMSLLVQSLAKRPPDRRNLLPNLTKLFITFDLTVPTQVAFINLLIGPALRDLEARGYTPGTDVQALEPQHREACSIGSALSKNTNGTRLLSLNLYLSTTSTSTPDLLQLFHQMPCLRRVKLRADSGGYNVYSTLGNLKQLRELSLSWSLFDLGVDPGDPIAGWFPSLRSANVDVATIFYILGGLKCTNIEHVATSLDHRHSNATISTMNDLFSELGRKCLVIESFTINAIFQSASLPRPGTGDALNIQPLLGCANVRRFSLQAPATCLPTDDIVDAMSSAWPNLEELHWTVASCCLPPKTRGQYRQPSLRSIAMLSQRCRSLRELDLQVDAAKDALPVGVEVLIEDICRLPFLEKLAVHRWWVSDGEAQRLAAILAALDPMVYPAWKWINPATGPVWREVLKVVDAGRALPPST